MVLAPLAVSPFMSLLQLLRVEVRGSAFYSLLPERQVFQSIAFCSKDPRPVGSEAGDGTCPGQLISLPDRQCP
ncbi:unnamed protein product [Nyctereutes procyonoides]|uniref:(raccoon dog) hypothetical protein n=1 Tax=Nyctereutes procyonoides TaxID=34880 RepID=A0A811YMZ4_NYCPR|nr:unnamed protein product [Nyctereutes procyonoides]